MTGFYLLIGKQGSGKTLMMTKLAFEKISENPSIRVFSNYELIGTPFTYITFDNKKERDKGKLDILKMLDDDPNYFDNSIMLLDEIHVYADSYDFMSKNNRRLQTFFSQLRKRNIYMLATTQYLMNLDIRLRRQCMNVHEMSHIKRERFLVQTYEIDGYYTKHVTSYVVDLSGYYNKYNTFELIL